jgi:uncharacterized protein YjbI with pentapeptide repeats
MNRDELIAAVKAGELIRELDLSHTDFSGADLSGAIFDQVDFHGSNFAKSTFKESVIVRCNFSGANLSLVNFQLTSVHDSCFAGAQLVGAFMRGFQSNEMDLTEAILSEADMRVCALVNPTLTRTIFEKAVMERTVLLEAKDATGVDFSNTPLSFVVLMGTDLRSARIEGTKFGNCVMKKANLSGRNLSGQSFVLTQLMDADLSGCDFTGADLTQTNFQGANLEGAKLDEVKAQNCFMFGASFSRGSARGSNFHQSIMMDGVFEETDFSSSKLTQCIFHKAKCKKASFFEADLTYAEFNNADVSECNFTGASLFRTRLHNITEKQAVFTANRALALGTDEELAAAEDFKPKH